MGGLAGFDPRGGPAARLALIRSRIAELRVRREMFEKGVKERRERLEEEERILAAEEAAAEEALLRQRRDLLAKVMPILKAEGQDVSNLEGVEKDEARWQKLLETVRAHRMLKEKSLATAEEIRRILP